MKCMKQNNETSVEVVKRKTIFTIFMDERKVLG